MLQQDFPLTKNASKDILILEKCAAQVRNERKREGESMKKYCNNCGKKVADGVAVCPECNTQLPSNFVSVPVPAQQPVYTAPPVQTAPPARPEQHEGCPQAYPRGRTRPNKSVCTVQKVLSCPHGSRKRLGRKAKTVCGAPTICKRERNCAHNSQIGGC